MTLPPSPFALKDYAFLGDGERGILVGPRGDMAWMCFPQWHSPSVFSTLLGGQGHYQVTPVDERYVWGGYYDDATLIWNDRWVTSTSIIECREALAFPGDPSRAVILRRVVAQDGPAEVTVHLDLRADYGRDPMNDVRRDGDRWRATSGPLHVCWRAGPGVRLRRDGTLSLRIRLEPHEHRDLVLEVSTTPIPSESESAEYLWRTTEDAWRSAVPDVSRLRAPRDARHAYVVMRAMTSGSGAMVAAATMSLPERAKAGRNYDYRYAWIRDQCYAGEAAALVPGGEALLDASVRFVTERLAIDGSALKPAYCVDGGAVPDEWDLEHLPGYPGATARAGNHVNAQFQLDGFGEALVLLAAAARQDRLDHDHWTAVEIAAAAIGECWQKPENGIWEIEPRWWTHSRLICVTGLRQIARCAPGPQAGQWTALADALAAETARTCVHPSGRWQRAPDDDRVDAALLLPLVRDEVESEDPRTLTTIAAIEEDLCEDGYLYRFRHDQRPLEESEGAFSLCGFLLALAYLRLGRVEDAITWFERNRASCGPPGLLTEEFDVRERQLRGNTPQAFVHAVLLECAARLSAR